MRVLRPAFEVARCATARRYPNPKRKRGIVLLTIRTEDCVLANDAELGDEVEDSAEDPSLTLRVMKEALASELIEDSAEESLADASGYERSAGDKVACVMCRLVCFRQHG